MFTMTTTQAMDILSTLWTTDPTATMLTNYAGAGTDGEPCVGYITGSQCILGTVMADALWEDLSIDYIDLMLDAGSVPMKTGVLTYFPRLQIADDAQSSPDVGGWHSSLQAKNKTVGILAEMKTRLSKQAQL